MSQFIWIYGLAGFLFVGFCYLIGAEIVSTFQVWALDNPGGYDTDVFNFYIALWSIIGVIFFFAYLAWNFVQAQKRQADYSPL